MVCGQRTGKNLAPPGLDLILALRPLHAAAVRLPMVPELLSNPWYLDTEQPPNSSLASKRRESSPSRGSKRLKTSVRPSQPSVHAGMIASPHGGRLSCENRISSPPGTGRDVPHISAPGNFAASKSWLQGLPKSVRNAGPSVIDQVVLGARSSAISRTPRARVEMLACISGLPATQPWQICNLLRIRDGWWSFRELGVWSITRLGFKWNLASFHTSTQRDVL